ncbi:MAG: DUF2207 domain-containing protein [Clostridia bacterium]|nr:DUF2207 domain-containing protein [Clostridia bacterium]
MNFYNRLVFILMSMSVSLLIDSLLVKIFQNYKEKKDIKKIEQRLSVNKIDYLYYRDILEGYSPAVLAFCYKKDIKVDDIIVSTLLDLERKNKIKIQNGKINTNTDINKIDITNYEKIILSYYNKKKTISKKDLYTKIKDETEKKGLIRLGNKKEVNSTYIMELFMAWIIIYILITIPLFVGLSSLGIWLFAFYFLTFLCIPIYKAIQSKIRFIIRTKKGIEISAKMQGLKRYIEEFSRIQDEGIENIELFEEYVIYAIIFDLRGKLNREVKELYMKLEQ